MPQKMRLNTSPKSVSFGLRTLSAAVVSALLFASTANAAGLGKLTVNSALGQPLRAEIELTSVSNDENGLLVPRLASTDSFRTAGIDINPVLYSLRFTVAKHDDGRQYISVTTAQPLNEPFVDMLIELGGNGAGRLVREYTFLLDPADLTTGQAPQIVGARPVPSRTPGVVTPLPAPAPAAQEAPPMTERPSARSSKQPQERPPKVVASKPAEQAPSSAGSESQYQVKSGDSLSKIAGQFKPEGASLDQMLVALYRNNQGAFGGNNMNRLRAGQVLNIPDPASVSAIGNGEAHGVIVAQAADFNEYRSKLAGQVASSEAQKSSESKQSASGKITAKVEEKASPAATSQDKLKLSKAGGASDKGSKIGAGEEDRVAKEKELAEANARVKQLEKNVTDLKSLLDVKSKNVAEQAKPEPKPEVKPVAPAPTPAPAPVAAATPTPAPVAAASAAASASAPKPDVAAVKSEAKPDDVASVSPPPKPPKPKAKAKPVPPPEPSLLDELLGNAFVVGGAALLLVAGGAFGLYRSYRKRKEKSFGDSIITDSSLKANSLFGSTGGQSVDTNNSVFNSNFAPSASQLDSNEVDPVAEADVYIAYGRDAQAEEILKEALRTQPERNAVRVKLLEIYANRKDVRSFETVASELYGLTKGEGEDWQQAASLGLSIDPKNPLYAAGKGGTAADMSKTMVLPSSHALDTAALDDLVPSGHEDMPHLGGSTLGQGEPDTVARHPQGKPHAHEDLPLDVSTSLDFDLDGIGDEPSAPADSVAHDLSHDLTHELKMPAAAPAPAPKHEAPAPADFSNIDFDFMNDAPAAKAPAPAPAFHHDDGLSASTTVARHDTHDFGSAALPSVPVIAPEEVPSHAPAKAADSNTMDFDLSGITLELDSNDKGAATGLPGHAAEGHLPDLQMPDIPMHEAKAPVAELHVPEFHIPEVPAAAQVAASPALHVGEIPALDLHPAEHHAPQALSVPEIHMPAAVEAVAEVAHHLEAPMDLDTGVDHEYSNNAEMATKLDLAVAYQEIGDKEGARELLDEVIKGGIPEYAEKAKGLLVKLG